MLQFSPLPELSVRLSTGEDLAFAVTALLVRLRLSQPTVCELSLRDLSMPPSIGTEFSVALGSPLQILFEGRITGVTHERVKGRAPLVRLRGYDRLHRLRQSQQQRGFDNQSTVEIAAQLARAHGLSAGGASGPVWARVLQTRQTDIGLLQEIAAASGLNFRLSGKQLRLISPLGDGAPLELNAEDDLIDLTVEENHDRLCRSVNIQAWDPATATEVAGKASSDASASLTITRSGLARQTDKQAQAIAEALAAQRAAARLVVRGLMPGNPALYAGRPIALVGTGITTGTHFVLSEVTHTLDAVRGFVSEFSSATSPPANEATRDDATRIELTLAEVTSVADPMHLGRVRARLIAIGGLETDWMQVLLPGAGSNKGLMVLPTPGDRVLVLLIGTGPTQGIVLGGMFGSAAPSDCGVDGDTTRRFLFQTPGGQRLVLDDALQSLRLEQTSGASVVATPTEMRMTSADGSFLSMTEAATLLHSNGDLTFRAPGRKLVIGADAIDFEQM